MNNHEKKVYRSALDTWGAAAQVTMVMEEMAELQKELCKNARGRNNLPELAEEIADVRIMLEQMEVLFDIEDAVEEYKAQKVERLETRISAYRERRSAK